ncbi:MAG: ComEC/Rec2 family competence protein [Ruminococcus sp.]|nr:ComEC/Rec2 family competence protein [Ruminococcus sp.]
MKRKMIGAAAAYLAGLFFASFFTGITSAVIFLLLALLILAGGIRGKDLILLLVFFAAAFAVSAGYRHFCYDRIVSFSGSTGDFSGEITGIESYAGDLSLYTLEGELNGITDVKVTYLGSGLDAEYGDILHLKSCGFSEHTNDYVFKNKDVYMAEKIFLSVDYPESVSVERTHSRKLKNALMNYREEMLSRFRSSMDGKTGYFLGAMVFGEKRGFDPDMRTNLYRSGVGHVMAVSGIHVSLIAVMIMAVLSRLRLGKIIPFILMNVLLIVFITMAEWPASAVRALIMADFAYSAKIFRRQSDTFNSLAGAVLVICIANPFVVYSSGFLLSVTATFGIGVFGPYMTKNFTGSSIVRSFLIMVCTNMCIFPLTIKYFGETSLISPVTNLLLLPLCSGALIIGTVFVMTGGILPVLGVAELLLNPVLDISDILSESGLTYFNSCGENSAEIIFALAAVVVVLQIVHDNRALTAGAMAAVFCGVMIIAAITERSAQNSLRIALLGKGSNTAAVISYKGTTRIFDVSGYYNSPVYVRKYLTENGISYADSVLFAENEPSQYSAYISELDPIKVGEWYSGEELFSAGSKAVNVGEEIRFSDEELELIFKKESLSVDFCGTKISIASSGKKKSFVVSGEILPQDILIDKEEKFGVNNFELKLSEDGTYEFRRL